MLIVLKNKETLKVGDFYLKCSIGKNGLSSKKKEGDKKTPKGLFSIGNLYYRADRVKKPKTKLITNIITKEMGWCDDPSSTNYNRLVKLPFILSAEKLWLKENIYDVIVVIDYNLKPVVKNKGSAIFLHIAKKNYTATEGCVAVTKKNMIFLLEKINNKTKIVIN